MHAAALHVLCYRAIWRSVGSEKISIALLFATAYDSTKLPVEIRVR